MDSFEWNKIFGAVLGTVLFVASLNVVVSGMMAPPKAEKPGMEVAVVEDTGGHSSGPVEEPKPDWGTLIPAADLAAGEKVHVRCQQCHDFAKGGPNKIGPNLFGVVGSNHAQTAGYAYSPAFLALKDKAWGYDEFDGFLKNPKGAIPGTKMSFAGLSKQTDRANLIAYLRTLSDSPLAVPAANPVAPPAAPADGTAEPPAGELQAPPPGAAPAEGTTPATPGAAAPVATTPAATTPAATAPKPAEGGGH